MNSSSESEAFNIYLMRLLKATLTSLSGSSNSFKKAPTTVFTFNVSFLKSKCLHNRGMFFIKSKIGYKREIAHSIFSISLLNKILFIKGLSKIHFCLSGYPIIFFLRFRSPNADNKFITLNVKLTISYHHIYFSPRNSQSQHAASGPATSPCVIFRAKTYCPFHFLWLNLYMKSRTTDCSYGREWGRRWQWNLIHSKQQLRLLLFLQQQYWLYGKAATSLVLPKTHFGDLSITVEIADLNWQSPVFEIRNPLCITFWE